MYDMGLAENKEWKEIFPFKEKIEIPPLEFQMNILSGIYGGIHLQANDINEGPNSQIWLILSIIGLTFNWPEKPVQKAGIEA